MQHALAIRRWEQIVRYGRRNPFYQIALDHLRSVSEAILTGVKSRKVDPNEIALAYQQLIFRDDLSFLRSAWEHLGETRVKAIRNGELRLSSIKNKLLDKMGKSRQQRRVDRVYKFIYERSYHERRRPTWETIQNDYYAWRAKISVETLKVGRSKATGFFLINEVDLQFLPPDEFEGERAFYNRKNAFFAGSLGNWANLPVVYLPENEVEEGKC